MTTENIDYRYHPTWGWDRSQSVPKENDLITIISKGHEYEGRVMRLVEDLPGRQTVEVCDDLKSGYGLHIRFNRKNDIRSLTGRDDIGIIPKVVPTAKESAATTICGAATRFGDLQVTKKADKYCIAVGDDITSNLTPDEAISLLVVRLGLAENTLEKISKRLVESG